MLIFRYLENKIILVGFFLSVVAACLGWLAFLPICDDAACSERFYWETEFSKNLFVSLFVSALQLIAASVVIYIVVNRETFIFEYNFKRYRNLSVRRAFNSSIRQLSRSENQFQRNNFELSRSYISSARRSISNMLMNFSDFDEITKFRIASSQDLLVIEENIKMISLDCDVVLSDLEQQLETIDVHNKRISDYSLFPVDVPKGAGKGVRSCVDDFNQEIERFCATIRGA